MTGQSWSSRPPARFDPVRAGRIPTSTARVAVNGVELYYEIHGQGSPFVMLHGGVNPSDMFGAPLAAMAKRHQVIAIHLRGDGFSTDTHESWTYEQMADDVAALLGKLGSEKIHFMGRSPECARQIEQSATKSATDHAKAFLAR